MKYILSEKEKLLAFKVGSNRNFVSKERGIHSNKKSKWQSDEFIDQNGAAGEIAFLGMMLDNNYIDIESYDMNLKKIIDPNFKPASLGLDDGDVLIRDLNIDVKTSTYKTAHLWITKNKKSTNKIDGYVLLTGNIEKDSVFFFKGYLDHKFIIENWNITKSGTSGKFRQDELVCLPFK
tara:strand:+ start:535 stop:1068 length:534 start_codon:yes stop_codon:yes gene_type:complete